MYPRSVQNPAALTIVMLGSRMFSASDSEREGDVGFLVGGEGVGDVLGEPEREGDEACAILSSGRVLTRTR